MNIIIAYAKCYVAQAYAKIMAHWQFKLNCVFLVFTYWIWNPQLSSISEVQQETVAGLKPNNRRRT